ncbi:uncharacterized protein LOC124491618 [Dermatophagoides farinae]|uniref:Uncharacterized protein n=1 Tax=Dermatophagoides farinae TaxID=6954 RepID=A0A922I0J9_DERFA|nr:uncharacterized protein LOC124491618 [Dermatophagoides farinae]KAH7646003.1 hypothetical protein HUG17_1541 [Dermatophagoides farinae]KAH9516308.1 hypothetical protein DERF_007059 [Dermatophagoides farinae]
MWKINNKNITIILICVSLWLAELTESIDHDQIVGQQKNQYRQISNKAKNRYRKLSKYPDRKKHYPHQYMIHIRWGKPGQNTDLIRKGDENSRYRKYAHEEEEHWHDKKWINIGQLPLSMVNDIDSGNNKKYMDDDDDDDRSIYHVAERKFNALPVFARPLNDADSLREIEKHFAIPSSSFPVNKNFAKWTIAPIKFKKTKQ